MKTGILLGLAGIALLGLPACTTVEESPRVATTTTTEERVIHRPVTPSATTTRTVRTY